ncbi:MAG: hypothetical protein RL226_2409 [Bacteroidota bacterium]|jgi:antitoxin component YwqK of YwqJK toxin-antitoxin module
MTNQRILFLAVVLSACGQTPESHVRETYPSGVKRVEYIFAATDSMNRIEKTYHPNGALLSEGRIEEGERVGEWKSFFPDSTLWSRHFYVDGSQDGDYIVNFENGKPRIVGQFDMGHEVGTWYFLTAEGDTAQVRQMD